MAEDEIRKHAKNALRILSTHDDNWKHKLKDVILEVLIIVFAVSISIWFHNLSDKFQERKDERQFLIGFKNDLKEDIDNMKSSHDFYLNVLIGMQYFSKIGSGDSLKIDSLKKYGNIFFSSTDLKPHVSRYEGIKSSGKLGIIENNSLLNKMIELNESTFPHIELLNNAYLKLIEKLSTFIQTNGKLDKTGNITNIQLLLTNPQMRFLLSFARSNISLNIIPAHQEGMKECNELLNQIDEELNK